MGLSIASTRFLVKAWKNGVRFDRILTLGRQHMAVSPQRIESILKKYEAWPPTIGADEFRRSLEEPVTRFENFARALGAKIIESCDASGFEGASLVHDFNEPIPAAWEDKYDLVFDGGTLEHVFNFPVAVANCMRMVKTGGHFILGTPANNYCGHGFYQFSPELFFRVLSPENGFQIEQMIATADSEGISSLFGVEYPFPITGPWYEVNDPARVRTRVTLITDKPVLLYLSARKVSRDQIFKKFPQQSDYVEQWKTAEMRTSVAPKPSGSKVTGWLRSSLSESFCREVLPRVAWFLDPFRRLRHRRKNSFHNHTLYRRLRD
ncbi:MAG: hypothetical protein ABI651_05230 [Verrucomicrobiota bacterium]